MELPADEPWSLLIDWLCWAKTFVAEVGGDATTVIMSERLT